MSRKRATNRRREPDEGIRRPRGLKPESGLRDALPSHLDESLKDVVRELARRRAPHEACGFIVTKDGKATVIEGSNSSSTPRSRFRLSAKDYEHATRKGKITMVWHSHVDASPDPSPGDMTMSEMCKLPFLIVSVPAGEFAYYKPWGYVAPLLGRPFVHGVLDCYSIIKDSFKQEKNIDLPDFERQDDWWDHGEDLYVKNFKKAGFKQVEEIQPYDVILMQINTPVINHAGLYLGDGLMRHHVQDRLSMEVPYVSDMGYYPKHMKMLVRHESLFLNKPATSA